jgi:hypothetical protein
MNQRPTPRAVARFSFLARSRALLIAPVLAIVCAGLLSWTYAASAAAERPFTREATARLQITIPPDELEFLRGSLARTVDELFRSRLLAQRDNPALGERERIVEKSLYLRFRRAEIATFGVWGVDGLIAQPAAPACNCDVRVAGRARFEFVGRDLRVETRLDTVSNNALACGICPVPERLKIVIGDTLYFIPEQRFDREMSRSVTVAHPRPIFPLPRGIRAANVEVRSDFVPVSIHYDDTAGFELTADVTLYLSGVLQYPDTEPEAVLLDAELALDQTIAVLRRRAELRRR